MLFKPWILIWPILKPLHLKPKSIVQLKAGWSFPAMEISFEDSFTVINDYSLQVLSFPSLYVSTEVTVLEYKLLPCIVESLSHLSVHMVNRLLRENWKTIPNFLSGKKTFKKCNPPDLKFCPSKLTDKNFPHMV